MGCVLVYKKKMDSQSIVCYVSLRSQHGSCAPSLNAPYLPLRDLEKNEEKKDLTASIVSLPKKLELKDKNKIYIFELFRQGFLWEMQLLSIEQLSHGTFSWMKV